jgi:hypothetical protein
MVRRALSAGGALRYGAGRMNGEHERPDDMTELDADAPPSRPWTPEAAMEPVPPLAPPPARPGAGTPVVAVPRDDARAGPARRLLTALALAAVIAVLVLVLVLLGR